MSGSDIASEIAAALGEVSEAVGSGAYTCTIRRAPDTPDTPATPWDEPADPANEPLLFEVSAVESIQDVRDMSGTLIGVKKRILTIDAVTVAPLKSDTIAVGVTSGDVSDATVFEEIMSVSALSPGGVALLYELELNI